MITSSSNPQIKRVLQLNTKGRVRRELKLFTAEGLKLFQESPDRWKERVYVSEEFEQEHKELLDGATYEVVENRIFARMCDTQTPQGILTVLRMPVYTREDLLKAAQPLLLVLEDLQDPGNVGTILRTAEGAGVTGVILSRKTVDLFHPKTIRSTMGSIFRVPFLYEDNLMDTMDWLKQSGIQTYAAHLNGKKSYSQADYRGGSAFLIGNEGNGLSSGLAKAADCLIRIPMEGQVESLNAGVAAAILMYTAHMQRHGA